MGERDAGTLESLDCLRALGAEPDAEMAKALETIAKAAAAGLDCEVVLAGLGVPFRHDPSGRKGTVSCSHEDFIRTIMCSIEHGIRIAVRASMEG